jgi:hypothetical protein
MLEVAEEAKSANAERQYGHISVAPTECELLFGHLSKLTTINPPRRWENGKQLELRGGNWVVILTLPGFEKCKLVHPNS